MFLELKELVLETHRKDWELYEIVQAQKNGSESQ